MMLDYRMIGSQLYESYKAAGGRGDMIDRVKSYFYGCLVSDHIKYMRELHEYLLSNGHHGGFPYVHGDDNNHVWYEDTNDARRKVVVYENDRICADDSSTIYTLDDIAADWIKFSSGTAGSAWDSEAGIKVPTLETYRANDFEYGLGYIDDPYYSFKYDSMPGLVYDVTRCESRLMQSLDDLKFNYDIIVMELG